MAEKDQPKTELRPAPSKPAILMPRPAEQRTLVPVAPTTSPVDLRPRTDRVPKTIAPPRTQRDDRPSPPASPCRPVREEPRQLPPARPTPMGITLGEELRAQLNEARQRGDKRGLDRAVEAGVALGIDDEDVTRVRKSRAKSASAKFAGAVKAARAALMEARCLHSEVAIERAIHRLREALSKATRFDPQQRGKGEILALLGTSETELEELPIRFFTTVTILPTGDPNDFYQKRGERSPSQSKCQPTMESIQIGDRMVEVIYRCGRPVMTLEPIRQIAPGEPIAPATPKLTLLVDGSCILDLVSERYLMRREEGQWLYYLLDADGNFFPNRPLVRTSLDGRPCGFSEPPVSSLIISEEHVQEVLLAFLHEIGDQRYCYVAVQMKAGHVVVYEVPWSEELLVGDESDPILELMCGFEPMPDPAPSTRPTAIA